VKIDASTPVEEVRARLGDSATAHEASHMLRLLLEANVADTDDLSDLEWWGFAERAVQSAYTEQ
jgi:hypothetical protein